MEIIDHIAVSVRSGNDEALHEAKLERDAIAHRLEALQMEIAAERRSPLLQLRRYAGFRILSALSRFSPPLPARTAARFTRSALKKDPNRSLEGIDAGAFEGSTKTDDRGWIKSTGQQIFDPRKKNILIVSHDSSRTGAPVLALNLTQNLSARYNVTVLVLRQGNMIADFKLSATTVVLAEGVSLSAFGKLIETLCSDTRFAFAVVNSVESHSVLKHLRKVQVSTVSLVHEFASYVRPNARGRSPFVDVFECSSEVVFSTRLTLEAAQDQNPLIDMTNAHVLPQGKCHVPVRAGNVSKSLAEKSWLSVTLRPFGPDDQRIVVIGAGTVNLRKGVDLFIETATRVLQSADAENVYFYWIGPKYDPQMDNDYSSYLREQIHRSGIASRMTMLRETTEIELAYSLADIFVLSSRLDPLPNVAIDAMSAGLPVLCFDLTSGIAGLLHDAELSDACVAPYIDTHVLAEKVLTLVRNPDLRDTVSAQSQDFAKAAFDFDNYATKIEKLGLLAADANRNG